MSSQSTTEGLSNHLLRTLAAVPVSSSVLELGCGDGRHTEALLRLGFPVHACDPRATAVDTTRERVRSLVDDETAESCVQQYSIDALDTVDATFDWIVAPRGEVFVDDQQNLSALLTASGRLLSPGGWLYLTLPGHSEKETPSGGARSSGHAAVQWSESDLEADGFDVDLVQSRAPTAYDAAGGRRLRSIYRHVVTEVSG